LEINSRPYFPNFILTLKLTYQTALLFHASYKYPVSTVTIYYIVCFILLINPNIYSTK